MNVESLVYHNRIPMVYKTSGANRFVMQSLHYPDVMVVGHIYDQIEKPFIHVVDIYGSPITLRINGLPIYANMTDAVDWCMMRIAKHVSECKQDDDRYGIPHGMLLKMQSYLHVDRHV